MLELNYDGSVIDIEHKASNVVLEDSAFYSQYLASSKLSNRIDGMKNIHRRILWGFYKIQSKDSYVLPNFQKMIGSVMEFHPHGDLIIKDVIDKLSQSTYIEVPLIRSDGSEGSYAADKGAAARYRKVGLDAFAYDLFFTKIDIASIPMKKNDNLVSEEPVYLVGRIPTNLWFYNFTIGSGFKSVCPPRSLHSVCELVKYFIDNKKSVTDKIDYTEQSLSWFFPNFPVYNTILNSDKLLQAYVNQEFNYPITVEGNLSINNDTVLIHAVPFGTTYQNVKEQLITKISTKGHWLNDAVISVKDLTNHSDYATFAVTFKRSFPIFKHLIKFKDECKFTDYIHPNYQYTDENGKIYLMTPPELLRLWYYTRKTTYINYIKRSQLKLEKETNDLLAAIAVVDHKEEVIDIIKNIASNESHALELLQSRFNLSRYKANLILNLNLKILLKTNKLELEDKQKIILDTISQNQSNMKNIDKLIYEDAEYFQNKYASKIIKTKKCEYTGYVFFPDKEGLIHFYNDEELYSILDRFSNTLGYVEYYSFDNTFIQIKKFSYFINVSKYSFPQYHHIKHIMPSMIENTKYFLYIDNSTHTLYEGHINITKLNVFENNFININKDYICIKTNGTLFKSSINDKKIITVIQPKTKGKFNKILTAIPYEILNKDHTVIVAYINTDFPNIIKIKRILCDTESSQKQLIFGIRGITRILHVFKPNMNNTILSITEKFRKHNSIQYVHIKNIDKILCDIDEIEINLSKASKIKKCKNMVLVGA
jgi:DNA gyrase/topoisomerase IV subunit A